MARRLAALALALTAVASGCVFRADDDGGRAGGDRVRPVPRTTTTLAAPAGDAFYEPPDPLPKGQPGDLIWAAPLPSPPEGVKAWRILYLSQTAKGDPTAVSGLLYAPEVPEGEGPLPILAIAHGTTGLADRCAPSRSPGGGAEAALLPPSLRSRFVIVATDYEGLGTPGVHAYVVGLSEGRNVLDSIRVAQRFPGIGTSEASKSVTFGHSQGGGAALMTAELAPEYAPDANLVAVAAGAPASELTMMGEELRDSPFFGYLFMAAAGFKAAYPELDLGDLFTPAGLEVVDAAGEHCGNETIAAVQGEDPGLYVKGDPASTEPYRSLLDENSPGRRSTTVPVFMFHGEQDVVVPAAASKAVLDRYCANGTPAYRKTWPDANHATVLLRAAPDVVSFLQAALEGRETPRSC